MERLAGLPELLQLEFYERLRRALRKLDQRRSVGALESLNEAKKGLMADHRSNI